MTWRVLPPLLFLCLAGLLAVGLNLNPREVPSPLVGKAAPDFSLPQLRNPEAAAGPADMRGPGLAAECVGVLVRFLPGGASCSGAAGGKSRGENRGAEL